MKGIITVAVMLFGFICYGQHSNPNWRQELKSNLDKFMQCSTGGDKSKCADYIGESLKIVYKVDDFYSRKAGRYMTAGEIADYLRTSGQWSVLGQSYDQEVLNVANRQANENKAVVAVYTGPSGSGHVVVITPGELIASGSWGLKVPGAASFFPVDPQKSFTDKGLSFAFSKQMLKDVTIYARKY
jgi:hypothetical protein